MASRILSYESVEHVHFGVKRFYRTAQQNKDRQTPRTNTALSLGAFVPLVVENYGFAGDLATNLPTNFWAASIRSRLSFQRSLPWEGETRSGCSAATGEG